MFPALKQTDVIPQIAALRTLAVFSLVSAEVAKSNMALFTQALTSNAFSRSVKKIALQGFFDLLLTYGNDLGEDVMTLTEKLSGILQTSGESFSDNFNNVLKDKQSQRSDAQQEEDDEDDNDDNELEYLVQEEEEDGTKRPPMHIFQSAIDPTNQVSLASIVAEGIAKLLFMERVQSPSLLSSLVVGFCSPAAEKEYRLKQCLSVFFPAFAFGKNGPAHRGIILRAFLPSIRLVSDTTHAANVARLFSFLLDERIAQDEWDQMSLPATEDGTPAETELHGESVAELAVVLAVAIAREWQDYPGYAAIYGHILGKISYIPTSASYQLAVASLSKLVDLLKEGTSTRSKALLKLVLAAQKKALRAGGERKKKKGSADSSDKNGDEVSEEKLSSLFASMSLYTPPDISKNMEQTDRRKPQQRQKDEAVSKEKKARNRRKQKERDLSSSSDDSSSVFSQPSHRANAIDESSFPVVRAANKSKRKAAAEAEQTLHEYAKETQETSTIDVEDQGAPQGNNMSSSDTADDSTSSFGSSLSTQDSDSDIELKTLNPKP